MIIQGSNTPIQVQLDDYEDTTIMSASLFHRNNGLLKHWDKNDIIFNGNILEFPLLEKETLGYPSGDCYLEIKYVDSGNNIRFVENIKLRVSSRRDKTKLLGADK